MYYVKVKRVFWC